MITVDQMVSALCKARNIPNAVLSDSEVQADAYKEAKLITDALNEIIGPPPPRASDIDPTAGLNPDFGWDGKDD